MNPSSAMKHICRCCGQRSASSFPAANAASIASRSLRLSRPSATRAFSRTSIRPLDTTNSMPSSEPSPSTLPSSMLSTNPPQTAPPPQPQQQQQPTPSPSINPFPPLPPTSRMRTTTGTVSKIHTNTATVTRNTLTWDKHLQKYYNRTTHDLVHDPTSLLHIGDVVKYSFFTAAESAARTQRKERMYAWREEQGFDTGRGDKVTKKGFVVPEGKRLVMVGAKLEAINKKQRNTKGVRFVVREVVTPFGVGVGERLERDQGRGRRGWLVDMENEMRAEQEKERLVESEDGMSA